MSPLSPLVELKCDIVTSPVSPGLTGHNGHKGTGRSRYRHRPWSTLYKIRVGIIMSNSYIVQHPHHLVGKYLYCPEKMPADTRQPDTRFAVIKRKILISNSPVSLDDVLCGEQGHFLLDTAGASLLSPRYLALCGHVFHWPVFTRDTSLYGRHT